MENNNENIIQDIIKEMKELNEEIERRFVVNNHIKIKEEYSYLYDRMCNYYENLPKVLKKNKDIIIEAINCHNMNIEEESLSFFSHDKEVAKASIYANWESADCFSDILDKDFILDLAKSGAYLGNESCYDCVVAEIKKNQPEIFQDNEYMKELLKYPTSTGFFMYATNEIKNNKEVVMTILTTHDIFVPYDTYKYIGDNLKEDLDIQKAFAQAMTRNYQFGIGEEAWYFIDYIGKHYDTLTDIDKKFTRKVINENGFIESAISFEPNEKENLELVKNKINQSSIRTTGENSQELENIFEEEPKESQDEYKPYR